MPPPALVLHFSHAQEGPFILAIARRFANWKCWANGLPPYYFTSGWASRPWTCTIFWSVFSLPSRACFSFQKDSSWIMLKNRELDRMGISLGCGTISSSLFSFLPISFFRCAFLHLSSLKATTPYTCQLWRPDRVQPGEKKCSWKSRQLLRQVPNFLQQRENNWTTTNVKAA